MTLEHCRRLLADPNLSRAEWNKLKDVETTLLKRRIKTRFYAACVRTDKYGDYRRAVIRALELKTTAFGGDFLVAMMQGQKAFNVREARNES